MYTEPTASLIMDLYTMDSFQFGVDVCVCVSVDALLFTRFTRIQIHRHIYNV